METYRVERERLEHDGRLYGRGDTVELSDAQASPLLALGAIGTGAAGAAGESSTAEAVSTAAAPRKKR